MKQKKIFWLVFTFAIIIILYAYRAHVRDVYESWQKRGIPEAKTAEELSSALIKTSKPAALPAEVNLDVPFSSQAPFANWDLPYKEGCEEMSSILVHYFYQGKPITPEIADREILKLVEWEKKYFGFYEDTNAAQTAEMLREYFGYKKVVVKYEVTADAIRKELAAGRPVIMPFAGQMLGNPYYRHPGPLYHMLVVKGYTKDGRFITNDVGTKRGKDYIYDPAVLLAANHEWNDAEITKGRKAMVVVYGNAGAAGAK